MAPLDGLRRELRGGPRRLREGCLPVQRDRLETAPERLLDLDVTGCSVGQVQTYGFQRATSLSSVALVTYIEVPFGYLLQYFVAREVPTTDQCAGSAVIVVACVAHTLLEGRARAAAEAK